MTKKNSPRKRAVFAFGEGKGYPLSSACRIYLHINVNIKYAKIAHLHFLQYAKFAHLRFLLYAKMYVPALYYAWERPTKYICRNPRLNRKLRIYRHSCFCLYSPGVMPANFLNARVKWLCEEKPRYEEIAERDLSVYRRRRFASSVFSFCI